MRDLRTQTKQWGEAAWAYVFEPRFVTEKEDRHLEVIALRGLLTSVAEQNEMRKKGHEGDIILTLPPAIGLLTTLTISDKQFRIEPDEDSLLKGDA
jgi:hypothetical protein